MPDPDQRPAASVFDEEGETEVICQECDTSLWVTSVADFYETMVRHSVEEHDVIEKLQEQRLEALVARERARLAAEADG